MREEFMVASTRELVIVLETLLGQPPAEAGMRLKAERELAQALGVDRMRVHRALDQLAKRGILTRKHGSGFYVRKTPKAGGLDAPSEKANHFSAVSIFADPPQETRLRPPSETARLHLGMWGLAESPNESRLSILRGMRDHAAELGHLMTLYPISRLRSEPGFRKDLEEDFLSDPCDGCIVLADVAAEFERAFKGFRPPTVYVSPGNEVHMLQPLVRIDRDEAQVRALRILANQGYQRIGFIGLEDIQALQEPIYQQTMKGLGFRYRASAYSGTSTRSATEAVKKLTSLPQVPDAIYVADDIVMRSLAPALNKAGLAAGKNLGVIVYSNRGNPLPGGPQWSQMEMDPYSVGRIALESLLREIATAGDQQLSFSHQAAWRPGETHLLQS